MPKRLVGQYNKPFDPERRHPILRTALMPGGDRRTICAMTKPNLLAVGGDPQVLRVAPRP